MEDEYRFIVRRRNVTWFEALDDCSQIDSKLLWIDSISEAELIEEELIKLDNQSRNLWHVGAHKFLYNMNGAAWISGRLIRNSASVFPEMEYTPSKFCMISISSSINVEENVLHYLKVPIQNRM